MKDIEKYLRDHAPQAPDEGQFLIEINARLNAVEGIKLAVDGAHRRWRTAVVVSLVTGLVLGCVVTALLLVYPPQPLQTEFSFLTKAFQVLQLRKEIVFGFIALGSVAFGLLFLPSPRRGTGL